MRYTIFALLALACTLPARALPYDRDARSPGWATADLACAASEAQPPACRDKPYVTAIPSTGGELLRGYLRRAVATGAIALPAPLSVGAGQVSAQGANQTAVSRTGAKVDDLSPVIHALREVTAAMGLFEGADALLAFAGSRAGMRAPGSGRIERAREAAAGFPFGALSGWSASLSGIHRSPGAQFEQALFNAIDPQRLIAWNSVRPELAPDRARAQLAGPGVLPDLLDLQRKESANQVQKKRTIIYRTRNSTTVMTLEDPPSK